MLYFHYEVLLHCLRKFLQGSGTKMVTPAVLQLWLQREVDSETGGPRSHKCDWHCAGEMRLPRRSGAMSRAGGESLVGRLESHCTTATLSVMSSDLSYGLYVSPNDLTVVCSEDLSGFLFSTSSGQREMSIVSSYYWNTSPASQSLLYLLKWKLLRYLAN